MPNESIPQVQKEDHRVRVAAIRREKMRARLLEAALIVFGERGVQTSVIDEVTAVAGVSRGTFYNYFRTNDELLRAVAVEVGNEMTLAVLEIVGKEADPAVRASGAVRLWLAQSQEHPHLATFVTRVGMYVLTPNSLVRDETPRHLVQGILSGRFTMSRPTVAFDLLAGPILAAIHSLSISDFDEGLAEELAERVLMAFGIEAGEARTIANLPLDPIVLPEDSLIRRTALRLAELKRSGGSSHQF